VRGRAERRRLTTSVGNSSAFPEPIPDRRMTDVRHSSHIFLGNSTATTVGYNVVTGIRTPPVVSPVNKIVRLVTVRDLALKIIPIINTLKTEVADIQLALSVLLRVELAIKELKEGFILLDRKCDVLGTYQVKTDAALKVLNQCALASEFSPIPPEVRKPPSILNIPTMVGGITNDVVNGPVSRDPHTRVPTPSVEMSMFDIDTLFQ